MARLPYGYIPAGRDNLGQRVANLEPVAVANVRWIFRRVRAGDSFAAIAEALNAAGIDSPQGGAWTSTTVQRIAPQSLRTSAGNGGPVSSATRFGTRRKPNYADAHAPKSHAGSRPSAAPRRKPIAAAAPRRWSSAASRRVPSRLLSRREVSSEAAPRPQW